MSNFILLGMAVCELISFIWIYYLWTKKKRVAAWERCLLTVVLLVPIAGWIFYGFIMNCPGEHSDILTEYDDGHSGSSSSHSSGSGDSH